jgi:4-hydroxy-3-methylbut-2-enyl diphosphate reductase
MELATKTAAGEKARDGGSALVYTLGPLIHNPQAVAELEAAGVVAISESEAMEGGGRAAELSGKAVVIRAHGVPPQVMERLASLGARIVDATCPRVLASQRRARSFAERGYAVVIAGEAGHAEVAGIAGCVKAAGGASGGARAAIVVGSPEEAARIAESGLIEKDQPVALIAQTTIRVEEYAAIREALEARFPGLEVVDSICPCTGERLDSLAELAREVDAIVVVGGRNSANTARLYALARELLGAAWLVETADELPGEAFGYGRVGLSAGASTPDSLIDEVEARLLSGSRDS